MSGRTVDADAKLVPDEKPEDSAYWRDFYSWSIEQARLIRQGRWDALDRENVAEEIESLGKEQFNKLESALRVLMMHMLKWDHQHERRTRSWELSIKDQRIELQHVIGDNPGLKPRIEEAIARAYRRARIQASRETKLAESRFPETCPYVWDDLTSRDFSR